MSVQSAPTADRKATRDVHFRVLDTESEELVNTQWTKAAFVPVGLYLARWNAPLSAPLSLTQTNGLQLCVCASVC